MLKLLPVRFLTPSTTHTPTLASRVFRAIFASSGDRNSSHAHWGYYMIAAVVAQVLSGWLRVKGLNGENANFSLFHRVSSVLFPPLWGAPPSRVACILPLAWFVYSALYCRCCRSRCRPLLLTSPLPFASNIRMGKNRVPRCNRARPVSRPRVCLLRLLSKGSRTCRD